MLATDVCDSGEELDDEGDCELCPRGFHKDNDLGRDVAIGPCLPCPPDTTTAGRGAEGEDECDVRKYTVMKVVMEPGRNAAL